MTQKAFEDLTIADDFMFCKVMEYEPICREFLEMLFAVKIEKITYLSSQNTVTANSGAKTVRLDVLVKDKAGISYDIEMSFSARHPCLFFSAGIHTATETKLCKKHNPSAFFKNEVLEPWRVLRVEP